MATWSVEFRSKAYDPTNGRVVLTFDAFVDDVLRHAALEVRLDPRVTRQQALTLIRERVRVAELGDEQATELLAQVPLDQRIVVWNGS